MGFDVEEVGVQDAHRAEIQKIVSNAGVSVGCWRDIEEPPYVAAVDHLLTAGLVVAVLRPYWEALTKKIADNAAEATLDLFGKLFNYSLSKIRKGLVRESGGKREERLTSPLSIQIRYEDFSVFECRFDADCLDSDVVQGIKAMAHLARFRNALVPEEVNYRAALPIKLEEPLQVVMIMKADGRGWRSFSHDQRIEMYPGPASMRRNS